MPQLKLGDRVVLSCGEQRCPGVIFMCSPNQQSLFVKLNDCVLWTASGLYADSVPLLMHEDGEYRDLIHGEIISVTPDEGNDNA